MKRLWLISCFAALALVSCSAGLKAEEAEQALKAAFEGDMEMANQYFCTQNQLHDLSELPAEVTFVEVDCQRRGASQIGCTTKFEHQSQERELAFIFRVKDDLLCEPQID